MKKFAIICLLIIFTAAADKAPALEEKGLDEITAPRTITQRNSPVAIGETAPDFTLEDQNGNKVTLSDSRGKNPVVLVFYRAHW